MLSMRLAPRGLRFASRPHCRARLIEIFYQYLVAILQHVLIYARFGVVCLVVVGVLSGSCLLARLFYVFSCFFAFSRVLSLARLLAGR